MSRNLAGEEQRLAEIFFEEKESVGTVRQDSLSGSPRIGFDAGVSVRVWTDEGDRYVSRSGSGPDSLREGLDAIGFDPARLPMAAPRSGSELFDTEASGLQLSEPAACQDVWEWLEAVEDAVRERERSISDCRIGIWESVRRVAVFLSGGKLLKRIDRWANLSIRICSMDTGRNRFGNFRAGRWALDTLLRSFPPARCADAACIDLAEERTVVPAGEAGRVSAVLTGEASGTFFHETCGHLLEADMHSLSSLPLAGGWKNESIPAGLTIHDDPTVAGMGGSARFDDEGIPCRRILLVGEGTITGFLRDRRSARLLGKPTTGNGRRGSYRDRPLPRLGNLFVRGGRDGAGEAIRSCEDGLLVDRIESGRVEPVTGEFRLAVGRARKIRKGRPGSFLGPLLLAGSARAALLGIEVLEEDAASVQATGTCVKEGQILLTGFSSPPVRFREMSVLPAGR